MNEPQPPFTIEINPGAEQWKAVKRTTDNPLDYVKPLPLSLYDTIRFRDANKRLWRVEGERELKIDDYILVGDEYAFGADWRKCRSLIGYRIDERHGFNYRRPAHLVEIEQPEPEKGQGITPLPIGHCIDPETMRLYETKPEPEKEVKTCATELQKSAPKILDSSQVASNEGERSNPVRPSFSTFKHWRKIRDENYTLDDGDIWEGPHGQCCRIDQYSHADQGYTSMGGVEHPCPKAKAWVSTSPIFKDSPTGWIPVKEPDQYSTESDLITKADFCCNEYSQR